MNPIPPIQPDPVPGLIPEKRASSFDPGKSLEFQRMLDRRQVVKPRDHENVRPSDEVCDAESVKHADEKAKPEGKEAESLTGEAESVTSEAESVTSEAESVTSEAESVTSEAESVTSEAESVTGEAESVTGEAESVTGEAESVAGEAESVTGEAESVTAEAETSDKESGDLLAGVLEGGAFARKKRSLDDSGADPRGGSGQSSMDASSVKIKADFVRESGIIDRVGLIESLSDLIARTAQQVDFQGHDGATIKLSPTQLPDSKVRIEMQQGVIQVIFNSTDASSLSLLQARGGEIAALLLTRFDREVRIEVREGDDASDGGSASTPLASWTVTGRSSTGGGTGGGETPA